MWIGLVRDFGPDFGESIPRPDPGPYVALYGGPDVAPPARASCQRDRGHAPQTSTRTAARRRRGGRWERPPACSGPGSVGTSLSVRYLCPSRSLASKAKLHSSESSAHANRFKFNGVTPHFTGISCTATYPNRNGVSVSLAGVKRIEVFIRAAPR